MHSFSTCTPTRRLVTGSNAAWLPPKASYLSSWTLVMTCIRPCAPTGLWANGLKLDSTAMTARISVGSRLAQRADGPGFLDQAADRLGRHAVAARQPVGDGGLLAGQILRVGGGGARRSRPARRGRARPRLGRWPAGAPRGGPAASSSVCASSAWRKSARPAANSTAPTTSRPSRASELWLTSSRPWPTSRRNTAPERDRPAVARSARRQQAAAATS